MQQNDLRGHSPPQYELFIRRSDHAALLVEKVSRRRIAIRSVLGSLKESKGLFVLLRDKRRVTPYLMGDEIHYCSEFPKEDGR